MAMDFGVNNNFLWRAAAYNYNAHRKTIAAKIVFIRFGRYGKIYRPLIFTRNVPSSLVKRN